MTVRPGRYRHFKGNEYQVLGIARHSETGENLVLYRPLYGEKRLWVRPLVMFVEQVEHEGRRQPRFARLPDAPSAAAAGSRTGDQTSQDQAARAKAPPSPDASPASPPRPSEVKPAQVTTPVASTAAVPAGIQVYEVNGREYHSLADVPESEQPLVRRALARATRTGEDPGERLVVSITPADIPEGKPDFSNIRVIESATGWAVVVGVAFTLLLLLIWLW